MDSDETMWSAPPPNLRLSIQLLAVMAISCGGFRRDFFFEANQISARLPATNEKRTFAEGAINNTLIPLIGLFGGTTARSLRLGR